MTTTMNQVGLTPEGRKRLNAELVRLERQMEELSLRLREEVEHKDMDDSNVYLTHQEMAQVQSRIRELQEALDGASPVRPSGHEGTVAVGSSVSVRDDTGREQAFTIVAPIEMDASRGYISFTSPVGRALLGRQAGDVVTVEAPRGERRFTIVEIE